jgi:hypothetical protein
MRHEVGRNDLLLIPVPSSRLMVKVIWACMLDSNLANRVSVPNTGSHLCATCLQSQMMTESLGRPKLRQLQPLVGYGTMPCASRDID